jgi:Na+/H+ antiporter NhaD/arsenite permease-like protein
MFPAVVIILIFIAVILLITFDVVDHTIAALIGASLAIIYLWQIWPHWTVHQVGTYNWLASLAGTETELGQQLLAQAAWYADNPFFTAEVFGHFFTEWIDLPTIIVILSLMVITEIAKDSGLFQFIAVKALSFSKGSPRYLLVIFCAITFLMSTVIATTVLIIGPLIILACDALEQNPTSYLIATAMCGNVGGITTVIASVPTMLVAGETFYGFLWFAVNMLPLGAILLFVTIFISMRIFRRDFIKPRKSRVHDLMALDAWTMVEDRNVFYRTAILFVVMIVGFIIFGTIGLTWVIAFVMAMLFVLLSGIPSSRIFREVDWTALFFFFGLFIIVGCMEEFWVLFNIGIFVQQITGGNPALAMLTMLWITGITSGAIDNIPVTATLIPVARDLSFFTGPTAAGGIWAALISGAVLGGALTPIASVANVMTMTVAERENRPINYGRFLRVGVIMFVIFLLVGSGYLMLRLFFSPIAPPPNYPG